MKKKTANTMKVLGATLAVCSAAAMMSAAKSDNMSAKKDREKNSR